MGKKTLAELSSAIARHEAAIQTIGSNMGAEILDCLSENDKIIILFLEREIKKLKFTANSPSAILRLAKLESELRDIRKKAFQKVQGALFDELRDTAKSEQEWTLKLTALLGGIAEKSLREFEEKKAGEIVKNGIFSDKTFSGWFKKIQEEDVSRIMEAVARGVAGGETVQEIMNRIRGTVETGYTDGVIQTTRNEAQSMARTLVSGACNNARLEFYQQNSDILIGEMVLSTLDGRTCPSCGGLDGRIFKKGEPKPVLPIHPQCRCTWIPITDLTDLSSMKRSRANSDFFADAKREYETKYPGKKWESLSSSTRKKYYFQAIRDYEKRTGKPAFTQVSGSVSFRDYFNGMSEQQKMDYLGPERYQLWKTGKVSLDKFIPPWPDRAVSVKNLKEMYLK